MVLAASVQMLPQQTLLGTSTDRGPGCAGHLLRVAVRAALQHGCLCLLSLAIHAQAFVSAQIELGARAGMLPGAWQFKTANVQQAWVMFNGFVVRYTGAGCEIVYTLCCM